MQNGSLSTLGSLVPSFLVSTCCLGPTLYVLFGVSVGGLSVFAPLDPYRPVFMVVAVALPKGDRLPASSQSRRQLFLPIPPRR